MMTADQIAAKMARRSKLVEKEFRTTMLAVGRSAIAFTKMKMDEEIYAIPEDLTRQGQARFAKQRFEGGKRRPFVARKGDRKWKRTGHLRRSEKFEIKSPYEVHIVNTAAYALPRHEAGKPGHRNINPARISHWHDSLREAFNEGLLRGLYHDTLLDILKAEGG